MWAWVVGILCFAINILPVQCKTCVASNNSNGMEQKTCVAGPNPGFKYLLTYKTLHYVHGIPITLEFSRVPRKGDKIKNGHITHALSRARKWADLLRNPCLLGVPRKGDKITSGYITPAFSGARGGQNGHINPTFSGSP